jgi:type I restriction enzyme S subunit
MPRIDSVKERLEKIPVILKRFRQSVLTAAVTGKLTEKWREEHPDVESAEVLLERIREERLKRNKPKKSLNVEDIDVPYSVPFNWEWCRLEQIILKMSTGPFGTMLHKSDYIENGIPVINPTNIKEQKLIPSDKMMISLKKYKELARYSLKENNIVLARRGDLSKCGIVTKSEVNWLCGTGSFYLELAINPIYFRFYYISDYCQGPLNTESIGSTMANLNQSLLSNIFFPLPPLEEQKEIVRQVDKLFSLADKVEDHYKKAKLRVDKLSQSVLAKAFRGELVPQDPNDEPAEKLLERILEEKKRLEDNVKLPSVTSKKKIVKKKFGT